MATITNQMRADISSQVIRHAFRPKANAMQAEAAGLMNEIYERSIGEPIRQSMERLQELVREKCQHSAFSVETTLRVNIGGQRHDVGRPHHKTVRHLVTEGIVCKPRFFSRGQYETVLTLEADDEFGQRIIAHSEAVSALASEIQTRTVEVEAVLSSCRTDRQLRVVWPDVMTIAEPIIGSKPPPPQLPAVLVQTLNASLGLPAAVELEPELEAA